MDELISNLEHCLSIFEAPTVASTVPNGMDILSLDNKYLVKEFQMVWIFYL